MGRGKKEPDLAASKRNPDDLVGLEDKISKYVDTHPNRWNYTNLQLAEDVRDIFNALRRVSRATYGTPNKVHIVVRRLGYPLPNHEEARKKLMAKTLPKLHNDLRAIHTNAEGETKFLEPNQVKQKNPGLYQRCVQHGGYAKLMNELFGSGTYDRTAREPYTHLLDKRHTLDYAMQGVLDVVRKHDRYVSAIQMSFEHPDSYFAALRALRVNSRKSRKRISYSDFFEKYCLPDLGKDDASKKKFTPPKELDMARMGYVGELFTYAQLYLEHPDASIFPGFPRMIGAEFPLIRYPIKAPNNISKRTGYVAEETYPDVTILAGKYALFVEAKAGIYFWRDAKEMTVKYHATKSKPLRPIDTNDKTEVIWAGVHLHFPLDGINAAHMKTLTDYQNKHKRPMKIFRPDYFEGFFARDVMLGGYYHEFISDPLSFVRTEGNVGNLEKRVLAVAPPAIQTAVMDFEVRLRT